MRFGNHNSWMVTEAEGCNFPGVVYRASGEMEGGWSPEGSPQQEVVEENDLREQVERNRPEKKGVLEAKDAEFQGMGKLLITVLCCSSGRYYFHFMGRQRKFGDLNLSFNYVGLISFQGDQNWGVLTFSPGFFQLQNTITEKCWSTTQLSWGEGTGVGEVMELKNRSRICCCVASFRGQLRPSGWPGGSTSQEASSAFNWACDFSQAGPQFPPP